MLKCEEQQSGGKECKELEEGWSLKLLNEAECKRMRNNYITRDREMLECEEEQSGGEGSGPRREQLLTLLNEAECNRARYNNLASAGEMFNVENSSEGGM